MFVFIKECQVNQSNSTQTLVTNQLVEGNGGSNEELIDENYSTSNPEIKGKDIITFIFF